MVQILALVKLEWKQQLRSGFILLLLAVAVLYANPFSATSPNLWENLARTVNGPSMLVLTLLLGLLGILAAQRERRQNVAVLIDGSAISSHSLFIGQWLGLVVTMLSLLIALHVLVTAAMLATGVHLSIIALLRSLFVICFPWALFMVTTGFVLGSFTPIFISIPSVGGIWYVTSVLAFFGRLGEWLPAPWEALIDPTTISTASASISFGFLPADRILTNRIFYLGVSVLILTLGALLYKRSRENRFNRGVVGLSLLGFSAILIAVTISWGQFLTTTNQVFRETEQQGAKLNIQTNLNQVQIERYEIDLSILPEQRGMLASVRMSVRNIGEHELNTFVFILNADLVLEKMAAVDRGQPLEWQKYGEGYYQVQMVEALRPGETAHISVTYSGSISEWYSPGWQKQPEPLAFIGSQGIVLPGGVDWYPVLAVQADPTWGDQAQPKPVETKFSVRVEGHSGLLVINLSQIGTNYWEGTASDLFLASANWHDGKEGDIHLWYTPGQGESADLLTHKLNFMYKTCENYLGKTNFNSILAITVPENLYAGLKNIVPGKQTGVIFVTDTRLDLEARVSPESFNLNGYQHELFLQVLGLWINPDNYDRSDQRYAKSLAIAGYMWTLFRDAFSGLPGTIEEEREFRVLRDSGKEPRSWDLSFPAGLTFFVSSKAENNLWFEFDQIRRDAGDSALKQKLQGLLSDLEGSS